ncbi:hypothetical protein LSM04_002578 [Trypanosoma melophagium]|uniref:uncharacterized protein n=1 Tax=Trypanosoma melophagium TaxID=715481 RepID=UPI003519DB22|nr:hypothetical protein LSM04_002578 [Trypanosoma melophagium]
MGGSRHDPSDPQVLLIHNVEDGLKRFGDASKEYVTAVRAVSVALEHLGVALRQLSLGEAPPELHARIDRFATCVGMHQSTAATAASVSSRRTSTNTGYSNNNTNNNSISELQWLLKYPLSPYINDFSRDVGSAADDLKKLAKAARRKQDEYESATKKYGKVRLEAEKIAKSDVKKNRNSSENPKYTKKMAKREKLRIEAEKKAHELHNACQALLARRAEVMTRVMDAMGSQTFQYWNGVAQLVQSSSMGGSHGV